MAVQIKPVHTIKVVIKFSEYAWTFGHCMVVLPAHTGYGLTIDPPETSVLIH
jgi:hypothetical protein